MRLISTALFVCYWFLFWFQPLNVKIMKNIHVFWKEFIIMLNLKHNKLGKAMSV